MSDDKLNAESNHDKLGKDAELITDSPSTPLESVDGPKRRKKEPRKIVEEIDNKEEIIEAIIEESDNIKVVKETIIEEVEEVEEVAMEEIVEAPIKVIEKALAEPKEEKPTIIIGVSTGSPMIGEDGSKKKKKKSKSSKSSKNVVFEETVKLDKSKSEEHVKVHDNEESKIPKTVKDRYITMLEGKNFEVRLKGIRIFDSPASVVNYTLSDAGITFNNKLYRYSEVVIRIKK